MTNLWHLARDVNMESFEGTQIRRIKGWMRPLKCVAMAESRKSTFIEPVGTEVLMKAMP
jgi:hypothetical protein